MPSHQGGEHVSPGEGYDPPCVLELKSLLRNYCHKAVADKKWLRCRGAPLKECLRASNQKKKIKFK